MRALREAWTMAGWADELPSTGLLARRFLDEPVVLFRDGAGEPAALADRCPHRFVPLSRGCHANGVVRCAYHGLAFDGRGHCVHNPHGDGAIPPGAQVRRYPVLERYGALWIWMGTPERADPAALPDLGASLDPSTRIVGKDYLLARAHYQLEIDNILDLSHIEFLHGDTLGSDAVRRAETRVLQEGRTVHSLRLTRGEIVSPALAEAYGIPADRPVDRWLDVRYEVPGQLELWSGWAATGSDDPRRSGRALPFVHLFTPETATTTHYWFATSYPRRMGAEGERRAQRDIAFLRGPFEREDLPVLEAQQQALGEREFWSMRPVLLPGDAAAVRARRLLDALIDAEDGRGVPIRSAPVAPLELRVAARDRLTEDICLYTLEDASGSTLPPFEAGAHIVLDLPGGLRRPYSLCSAPSNRAHYQIAVRRAPDSRGGSALLHDSAVVGTLLRASPPRNRFRLATGARSHTLLAAGIGLTPLLAMAEALHARGSDFALHVFARSPEQLPFARRLADAPWADCVQVHFRAGGSAPRIGVDVLVASLDAGAELYVCGPPAFMQAAMAAHRARDLPATRLHTETFTASGDPAGPAFDVRLARSGHSLVVPAQRSLVQALAEVGIDVPVSCGQGLCGTCRVRVLEGRPHHDDQHIAAWDNPPGGPWMLACCGRAEAPGVVLDL
jgi:vanillate O-demethylase monooxygenase subunit